ncbi:suppressor of fused domain protein [Paenibacillus pinisoli]|uniref:Suppressor of fused domain protein n=1 Tax=Paenibacillus pinisoli TaxID=1276110 RepID=A0A3A6PH49_9BACL|nr:suppressor of fused domain protein [Paenibacillus pinisoli]RJX40467.1 suppressor of fused domain protein [Paenibacillus pinisoli]
MSKSTEYSDSGSPVYRYSDRQRDWQPAEYGEEEWVTRIEEHVQKYIGEADSVFHEILSDIVHIDVHVIKPTPERNFYTLFTTGMSFLPMNTPEGAEGFKYAELMICLPPDWPIEQGDLENSDNYWPIRWLKMLARFPHEYDTWLGWEHTMPNGDPAEPLSEQTDMCGIILLPPLQVHEDFLTLDMGDGREINFYAIVPLYSEELDLKLKQGSDPLLDKFEEYGVDELLDVKRRNTCKGD